MSQSIVMEPAFCYLGVIISLEGGIVFHNVMCCIYKRIVEHTGAPFGQPGAFCGVVAGLINRRVSTGKCRQLVWGGETVYVTDFSKNHSAVDVTNTRNC